MKLTDLKKLIKLFESSAISELEIEQEGERVLMKKGGARPDRETAYGMVPPPPSAPAEAVSAPEPSAPPAAPVEEKAPGHIIRAPMVGMFFRSPSPTSPPFIEEGDLVRRGQVLCIIEAMKLMNEIECDIDGAVVNIFPENGKPVEFGQPLLEIEPA